MSYLIIFLGITLVNIIKCVVYGFSDNAILPQIAELSYTGFAAVSLILTVIYNFLIFRRKNGRN